MKLPEGHAELMSSGNARRRCDFRLSIKWKRNIGYQAIDAIATPSPHINKSSALVYYNVCSPAKAASSPHHQSKLSTMGRKSPGERKIESWVITSAAAVL